MRVALGKSKDANRKGGLVPSHADGPAVELLAPNGSTPGAFRGHGIVLASPVISRVVCRRSSAMPQPRWSLVRRTETVGQEQVNSRLHQVYGF